MGKIDTLPSTTTAIATTSFSLELWSKTDFLQKLFGKYIKAPYDLLANEEVLNSKLEKTTSTKSTTLGWIKVEAFAKIDPDEQYEENFDIEYYNK